MEIGERSSGSRLCQKELGGYKLQSMTQLYIVRRGFWVQMAGGARQPKVEMKEARWFQAEMEGA